MRALAGGKPYLEYHAGRRRRKVSPTMWHSWVQSALVGILRRCGEGRYRVGTEGDFNLSTQVGSKTILVPDVYAVAIERFEGLSPADFQRPPFAPDVAVEVRSPSDRRGEREWKVKTYLDCGTSLVLDVLPEERILRAITHDAIRTFRRNESFEHERAPWLRFELAEGFADLTR